MLDRFQAEEHLLAQRVDAPVAVREELLGAMLDPAELGTEARVAHGGARGVAQRAHAVQGIAVQPAARLAA